MGEQQVKGTAIIPQIVLVRTKYGEIGWEQLLTKVSPLAREVLSHKVLPITWYPHEVVSSLLDAMVELYGQGDPSYGHRIGKEGADYGLTLIHKFILRLRSPSLLASRGPEVWSSYYQPSIVEVVGNRPGAITIQVRGMRSTPAHLYAIAGWMERVAELTGGRNSKCAVDIPALRFEITYDP